MFISLATVLLGSLFTATNAIPARRQTLATVYTQCTVPKTAALTFDDGPSTYTTEVSTTLKAAGAKGTFFFNGNNFDCIYDPENVAHVRAAYSDGHQIASHTWAHLNLTALSKEQVTSEISRVDEAFERLLGVTPAMIRPPFGAYNTIVQEVAGGRGQSIVNWDFDAGDADLHPAAQSIADYQALANQNPPTILALNHDTYATTAKEVLPAAIAALKAKGYSLVTVAECLGLPAYLKVSTPQTGTFSCT